MRPVHAPQLVVAYSRVFILHLESVHRVEELHLKPGDDNTLCQAFREGRIGYRLWAAKTGLISPSVEDRYDHDVDELMA